MSLPRRWAVLLSVLVAVSGTLPRAQADLLPPGAQQAQQRLRDNPKAFDRADTFCAGRKVGAVCTIPGDVLAGGGAGICRNALDATGTQIDLSCERSAKVVIDRQLPAGGFAVAPELCASEEGASVVRGLGYACKPAAEPLRDRFCAGRAAGAACSVTLTVDGKPAQATGVCTPLTERSASFYFRGRHTATRSVLRCESAKPVERRYTPATWWQKARR